MGHWFGVSRSDMAEGGGLTFAQIVSMHEFQQANAGGD